MSALAESADMSVNAPVTLSHIDDLPHPTTPPLHRSANMAASSSNSPDSSPVIRRAPVTYGRRRAPVDGDTSTSPNTSAALSTRSSPYGGVSSEPENDFPPDSDSWDTNNSSLVAEAADDEASGDENIAPSPGNSFGWKSKLKELDATFDERESSQTRVDDKTSGKHIGSAESSQQVASHSFVPPLGGLEDDRVDHHARVAERVQSLSVSPIEPRRAKRRAFADNSDSDSRQILGQSSPATSPSKLHHIYTPQSRSPTTPPSSLDMTSHRKGKERAVEPLLFDEELPTAKDKKHVVSKQKTDRGRVKKKGKDVRSKAPTKKERVETQKATARIIAEQPVAISRAQTKVLPLTALFKTVERRMVVPMPPEQKSPVPSSDPIQSFSSPSVVQSTSAVPLTSTYVDAQNGSPSRRSADPFVSTGLLGDGRVEAAFSDAASSSDEEMPDISTVLQQADKKKYEEEMRRQTLETKQRIMEQQMAQRAEVRSDQEDDSDLEVVQGDMQIVAQEEAQNRRALQARNIKPSVGRKNQLAHAGPLRGQGVSPHKKGLDRITGDSSVHLLQAAAAPAFSRQGKSVNQHGGSKLERKELYRILQQGIQRQAEQEKTRKEDEWVRRGGTLKTNHQGYQDAKANSRLLAVVSKGLSTAEQVDDSGEESDEEGDGEYQPEERGSASEGEGDMQEINAPEHEDSEDASDQENAVFSRPRQRGPSRRPFATVLSDDENDVNIPKSPESFGRILIPGTTQVARHSSSRYGGAERMFVNRRNSLSSQDERLEDGTDKENDARLMFDQGEDKENTAVHARSPTLRPLSLRPLSLDLDDEWMPRGNPFADRTPLKEIPRDDEADPFAFTGQSRRRARQQLEALSSDTPLRPLLLTDAEPSSPVRREVMSAPASPLSMGPPPMKAGGFSQFFSRQTVDTSGLDKLRMAENDFSLTFEVGLQPALEVSGTLRKRADGIFEKEQEYLVEEAARPTVKKPQIYVNENGFLTQTRPDVSSPEEYRLKTPGQFNHLTNLTQPSAFSLRTNERHPLGPIDFEEVPETPEEPRRRLKKRDVSPAESNKSGRLSMSPTPIKVKKPVKIVQPWSILERPKATKPEKLEKSEFIEGEAEESDDDAMLGFGGPTRDKDDEEEDGEDQDQTLTELVDDAQMDADTLAEEKVMEKVREHMEQDDAQLEKIHRDAAEGKMRVKRRDRGINFEDSESDSDDETARRLRRKMSSKKRKIDGDTLEQLAKHQDTLPFVEAYHADILDDDDEFAHLQQEVTLAEEDDTEVPPEAIDAAALREELREMSRKDKAHEAFDPDNVAWLDESEDEEILRVKVKEFDSKRNDTHQSVEWDVDAQRRKGPHENDPSDDARLQKWASRESSSRMVGAGRNNGGSAVTGHGTRAAGGGSVRRAGSSSSNSANVTRTASVLSAVSSRRSKFNN